MHMQNGQLDTPMNHQEQTCRFSIKVPWLFDELSVAHTSLTTSHHSAISCDVSLPSVIEHSVSLKWTVILLQNYKYSLYPPPLFEFFTLFPALLLVILMLGITMPYSWDTKLMPVNTFVYDCCSTISIRSCA